MRTIALKVLFFDIGRSLAALLGAVFASFLVFVQLGIERGYAHGFVEFTEYVGGDVWILARNTEYLDLAEPLPAGVRAAVSGVGGVVRVRPLVFADRPMRKASGPPVNVRIIGLETSPDGPLVPWNAAGGLAVDVSAPMRVSVDRNDLRKLELADDPIGVRIDVAGHSAVVAGVSTGIVSSATFPFLFANVTTARRLTGMEDGSATFWLVDVRDEGSTAAVIEAAQHMPGVKGMRRVDAARMSERYWMRTTGVGAALMFVAVLGLVIGAVIVGQSLLALVRAHERELATLRALGATRGAIAGFVAWQAGAVGVVGIALGLALAAGFRELLRSSRLIIMLPPATVALGCGLLLLMCAAASAVAVRRVIGIEATLVFA